MRVGKVQGCRHYPPFERVSLYRVSRKSLRPDTLIQQTPGDLFAGVAECFDDHGLTRVGVRFYNLLGIKSNVYGIAVQLAQPLPESVGRWATVL